MNTNEIIALGIVAVAAIFAIRHFMKTKGGCCGKDCSKAFKKKDEGNK